MVFKGKSKNIPKERRDRNFNEELQEESLRMEHNKGRKATGKKLCEKKIWEKYFEMNTVFRTLDYERTLNIGTLGRKWSSPGFKAIYYTTGKLELKSLSSLKPLVQCSLGSLKLYMKILESARS